jgi:hypothetical protein
MIKPEAEDTSAKIIADDLIIVAGTGRIVERCGFTVCGRVCGSQI